jgi:indolepyruvate decarboxylase
VAAYLAKRLEQAGVGHLFGVPGDFCLPFFDATATSGPEVIVACNELNAGYAADGYARLNGIGALAVTWNVGSFSALNAIAGASAERVPVVAVCGAPPRAKRLGGVLHHTAGAPGAQGRILRAVVADAVRLDDPQAAPALVDAALARCLAGRRPAVVELPVDVSRAPCAAPGPFAPPEVPGGDPAALDAAVARASALLEAAGEGGTTVLAGIELARFGLGAEAVALIEQLGARFVTTVQAKAVLPETHPAFAGVYIGELGEDAPREAVDGAGAVLALGSLLTDLDLGLDTARFDRRRLIVAAGDRVRVGRRVFRGVALPDFVRRLRVAAPAAGGSRPAAPTPLAGSPPAPVVAPAVAGAPLTARRFFELVRRAIDPGAVVLADVGDAMISIAGVPMPAGVTVLCQAFYASVGWSVPAAVGASFAAPARALLGFVGDGAFQMAGQELSTLVRHGRGAAVFVLDNGGYLMERTLHEGPFNDLNPWRYAELGAVYGGPPGLVAATEVGLEAALDRAAAHPGELTLVQVRLGPRDASDTLRRFGEVVHAGRPPAGPAPGGREKAGEGSRGSGDAPQEVAR